MPTSGLHIQLQTAQLSLRDLLRSDTVTNIDKHVLLLPAERLRLEAAVETLAAVRIRLKTLTTGEEEP
jgi:hypothetical protein